MSPGAIIDAAPGFTDTQVATILSSPLSVNGVPSRRAKAPKLSGAIAAHASSSMFKGPQTGKPKAKRWDHRLSEESKSRAGSTLKAAVKHLKNPKVISLGGGLPTSDYFPFESLTMKVPKPPGFSPVETQETGQTLEIGKHDYRDGKSLYDINIAFNYAQSTGSAQLLRFITEHTEIVHKPRYEDWTCTMTVGSTSAFDVCLRMLAQRGDTMMSEEYTFVSAVETAQPMGINTVGIDMDEQGLKADVMDELLSKWDEGARGSPKPHLLYTVPTGQNPTGATQSLQRRREIYAVAQKHDLIIIEDEPYYFLQMDPYVSGSDISEVEKPSTHEEFLDALIPSYLSMDTDGRVVRLDSFSKIVAPGSRLGWITASDQLVERFVRHAEVSTQMPSGISQLLLYKLLEEGWGHSGFLGWLQRIRSEYTRRRDGILRACEDFLPSEVARWAPPMAGMFHWIQVDWKKHPKIANKAHTNGESTKGNGASETDLMLQVEDELFLAAVDEGALVSKGSWFRAEQDGGSDMFLRATFAAASEEDIREAIKRLGTAMRKYFELP